MVSRWDVLLVSDRVRSQDADGCFRQYPPVVERVDLAPRLWIGGIDPGLARAILGATSRDRLLDGALYAYVLEDPSGYDWDPAQDIANAVGLSHLIRATETSFEYSATVKFRPGSAPEVERAPIGTPYLRAWCTTERHRRWLSRDDAALLRELIARHKELRPVLKKAKTGRALSAFAQTPYLYDAGVRALGVACLLEALVNSGSERPTAQFHTRVPLLAKELGISGIDIAWAKKAYGFRSALAHGGDAVSPLKGGLSLQAEFENMVGLMEDLVRDALRRALLEPTWRAALDDPQEKWPVLPSACAQCRDVAHLAAVPLRCQRCGRDA